MRATGGNSVYDITDPVDGKRYRVHEFTTVGESSLIVSSGGECEYLIVGGGGEGGYGACGGGGGGGGVLRGSMSVLAASIAVTVGDSGEDSTLGDATAISGGSGDYSERNGGSGGGGKLRNTYGGEGIAGQGHDGGNSFFTALIHGVNSGGGGGGGAGTAGTSCVTALVAGNGGDGITSSITGVARQYAGGGGGGSRGDVGGSQSAGIGGSGGGGNGAIVGVGANGNYYGGGGGGGGFAATAFAGGIGYQGIVIVRYLLSSSVIAQLRRAHAGIRGMRA